MRLRFLTRSLRCCAFRVCQAIHSGIDRFSVRGDGLTTVTGTLSVSGGATLSGAVTASSGFTVTSAGLSVSAGGLRVAAGGLTVTAGGLTVTAGGLQVGVAAVLLIRAASRLPLASAVGCCGALCDLCAGIGWFRDGDDDGERGGAVGDDGPDLVYKYSV